MTRSKPMMIWRYQACACLFGNGKPSRRNTEATFGHVEMVSSILRPISGVRVRKSLTSVRGAQPDRWSADAPSRIISAERDIRVARDEIAGEMRKIKFINNAIM